MERKSGESYVSYAKRLTNSVEDGIIEYKEYGDSLLGIDNNYSSENIRKFYYMFKKWLNNIDDEIEFNDESFAKEMEKIKFDVLVERKKLQRINREYLENARLEADKDLYGEIIKEAIENLEPIKIRPASYMNKSDIDSTGVLFVSDAHYSKEFEMKGLFGETINKYSPEIFKQRMWKLLSDVENDFNRFDYKKLVILDTGDCVEGILRLSDSIQKLKVGVMDSALEYGEFMSVWICEAYNRLHIPIEYSLTTGNHDIVRILTNKKSFSGETVAKQIHSEITNRVEISKLKAKLESGKDIQIEIKPYQDISYNNLYGINLMSYHGDCKNMNEDIEFFENYYGISIDILVGGHLHRSSSESIGFGSMGDREIIRVPSIMGVEDYSKTIRKSSCAGAKFILFNENGKDLEKVYILS